MTTLPAFRDLRRALALTGHGEELCNVVIPGRYGDADETCDELKTDCWMHSDYTDQEVPND